MVIYHGSDHVIEKPEYMKGRVHNDYGRGFYCTEDVELAKEWACKTGSDGFINSYELEEKGLRVLDLRAEEYSVLHWITLLLANRTFRIDSPIAFEAMEFLQENYGIDLAGYDVVVGYRADDSYFRYAEAFLSNSLSVESLSRAMELGNLGLQRALVSKKAFRHLEFLGAEPVLADVYFQRYFERDRKAREDYRKDIVGSRKGDVYIMDILRGDSDDLRI